MLYKHMIHQLPSILIIIVEAAGHSWVFNLRGDIKDGLPRHGPNTHAHPDHYYARPICPAPLNLSQCENYPPPYKPLDASSQRPCRLAGSPGAPNTDFRAEVTRGGKLHISWMGNGHTNSVSDGTCVQIKIAPYKDDPSFDDFTTLEECHPYYNKSVTIDTTSATITIPRNLTVSVYYLTDIVMHDEPINMLYESTQSFSALLRHSASTTFVACTCLHPSSFARVTVVTGRRSSMGGFRHCGDLDSWPLVWSRSALTLGPSYFNDINTFAHLV